MRYQTLLIPMLVIAFTASAFAANFSPDVLRFSAPTVIDYQFDGVGMYVPVYVGGTEAEIVLTIFVKEQYHKIHDIRNGHLGWHYLNSIDTCIYASPPYRLSPGRNVIPWDGKNFNGTVVPPGEYTYYLWGYDPATPPIPAARHIPFTGAGTARTHDGDGLPLAHPVIYPSAEPGRMSLARWTLGNDPEDRTLVETTTLPGFDAAGTVAFSGSRPERLFAAMDRPDSITAIRAYSWTPNGEATLQTDWGETPGETVIAAGSKPEGYRNPGLVSAESGKWLYTASHGVREGHPRTMLYVIDGEEGDAIPAIDISSWWITPEGEFAGPTCLAVNRGFLALGSSLSCLHMLMEPGDPESFGYGWPVRYANGYGDGIGEIISGDASHPWACLDPESPPHARTVALDHYRFASFAAEGLSGVSFGLLTPDGRGLGHFAFAGETGKTNHGHLVIDSDSAFDGFYLADADSGGIRYVARDTIKGTITTGLNWEYTPYFSTYHGAPSGVATLVLDTARFFTHPGELFSLYDEVGVFAPSGVCAGYARPQRHDRLFLIHVRADNPSTPEIEGMREGEPFTFRLWDLDTGREHPMTATYETGEAVFHDGVRIVLKSLVPDISPGVGNSAPEAFSLLANYPNPFNPSTTITFILPKAGVANLTVYDATGRKVAELVQGFYPAGRYSMIWNARDCASGVYFCTLRAGDRVETRKMLLVR